ncbi:hypothetical protein TWF191_001833 [Orbilia oligospora]|uniref:ATPase AAA-type core domain-containing protein n=1 Tax=Orbilia oligospora TaxID=2813651 RepID=A0A7C8UDH1_ORBOL|nr:hypothetical protein TWF191_001833 [Orbilia oligospora]
MSRSDDGDPQNKNRKRNSSGAEDSSTNSNRPAKKLNTRNDVKKRPVGRPPLNKAKGSRASGEENSKDEINTENLGHSDSTDKNNQSLSLIKTTEQECIPVEEGYLWDKSRIIQYQDNTLWMHGILTRAGYNGVCQALGHNWDLEEEDRDFTANMIVHYDIERQWDIQRLERSLGKYLSSGNSENDCLGDLQSRNVEKWLREGADPNLATNISAVLVVTGQCIFPVDSLPVIAFAALLGEPKIVRTLLSFGAKSSVIPSVLRLPYIKPQIFQLKSWEAVRREFLDNVTTNKDTEWCNDVVFNRLRKCLNLSMRYDLHRGPSGHGKTELAKQMERYLGVPFHSENMASVKREDEFFGPHKPYKGWEEGSPVNNFLADNNGKRCIVLLDEVEKTGINIRNALLVPFERGATLSDRRGGSSKMDISKVIWILATNALDSTIMRFYEDKEPITPQLMAKEGQEFVVKMRKTLHGAFGAAFTSRIDLIIPFFPFSPDEQAVLADLEIGERKIGNINLSMQKDYKVCRIVAKSYMVEEGVRSIKREVDNLEKEIFDQYLDASEDAITEENQKNETEYTLKADRTQGMVRVDVGKTTPKLQLG